MRVVTRSRMLAAGLAGLLATLPLGAASEKIDYEAINKIKEQGLQPQNSKVMEIASWLTDVYGPRLTGFTEHSKSGRMGGREDEGVGAPERRAGEVARPDHVPARMGEREVL